jgi:hypothetical protein
MKISQLTKKLKADGHSKEAALTKIRMAVKAAKASWSARKIRIFNNAWEGKVETVVAPTKVEHPVHTPEPVLPHSLDVLSKEFSHLNTSTNLHTAQVFYNKLWIYYNHLHFSNKLPKPVFRYLKDTAAFRGRAHYRGGDFNQFSFSKRLFNADFPTFCETFVHEMCHQAQRKIDEDYTRTKGGKRIIHGTTWKKWMRHCGLDPERWDKTDAIEYLDPEQKQEALKLREIRKTEEQHKQLLVNPKGDTPAQYFSDKDKTWVKGVVCCPENDKKRRYVFIHNLSGQDYRLVPATFLHAITDPDELKLYSSFDWKDQSSDLRNRYLGKKKQDTHVRLAKKLARGKVGMPSFEVSIIPHNRRTDYIIVSYVLTKTRAKDGHGTYNIQEMNKLYRQSDLINALYWMQEVDGKENVYFSEKLGSLSLSIPTNPWNAGRYSLYDFQESLETFYKDR